MVFSEGSIDRRKEEDLICITAVLDLVINI